MEGPVRYQTILGRVPFSQYGQYFRLVEEEDYEFIFLLRSDKELGRHLSKTREDPESQRIWIREYKLRERSGDEFYFISIDPVSGEKLGVFRLYNFTDNAFGTGSWLYKPGLRNQPILGNITGKEIGFNFLQYDKCRFDVRKENKTIMAYHRLFHPTEIGEDDLNFYFELSRTSFETTKNRLLRLYGYGNKE
jgi:RimJ/RimL family protein N-acetyltransferase